MKLNPLLASVFSPVIFKEKMCEIGRPIINQQKKKMNIQQKHKQGGWEVIEFIKQFIEHNLNAGCEFFFTKFTATRKLKPHNKLTLILNVLLQAK